MDIRSLLGRCRHAQEELTALRHQIMRLNTHGSASEADQYQKLLLQRERETVENLTELERVIGSLGDARTRTVMRYYYAVGLTDAQIGEALKITDEWARKKRYAAVRGLERWEKVKNTGNAKGFPEPRC